MTSTYTAIDARALGADLGSLTDEEFRAVVDADLRRNARKEHERHGVTAEQAEALRRPENIERWYATLKRIAISVKGQLATRADEHDARQASLRRQLLTVRAAYQDAPTEERRRALGRQIVALEAEAEQVREEYLIRRKSTVRFQSGLEDTLAEAQGLRAVPSGHAPEELAACLEVLTGAINHHRWAIEEQGLEPTAIDRALWSIATKY